MEFSESFKFDAFPKIPVLVKGSCNVFYDSDSLFTPYYCMSSHRIFVPNQKSWPIGSEVRLEIRILDEVRCFVGRGRIEGLSSCPTGTLGRGVMIRLEQMQARRLGIGGRLNQLARANRLVRETSVGAVIYALSEARGNVVEQELGEPHAGFRDPVLLIQGYFGTRGVFNILENRLKSEGFPVFSFYLGRFNIQDIVKTAHSTAEKLHRFYKEKKFERISIVGHSMGGLIGLYMLKFLGISPYVRRMIAVGTPFHGTPASYLGIATMGLFGKSVWQMTPGSAFLQKLMAAPMPEGVEVISIMSRHDMLAPDRRCVLEGAKNMLVASGHAALIVKDEVYQVLSALLKNQSPFA